MYYLTHFSGFAVAVSRDHADFICHLRAVTCLPSVASALLGAASLYSVAVIWCTFVCLRVLVASRDTSGNTMVQNSAGENGERTRCKVCLDRHAGVPLQAAFDRLPCYLGVHGRIVEHFRSYLSLLDYDLVTCIVYLNDCLSDHQPIISFPSQRLTSHYLLFPSGPSKYRLSTS